MKSGDVVFMLSFWILLTVGCVLFVQQSDLTKWDGLLAGVTLTASFVMTVHELKKLS